MSELERVLAPPGARSCGTAFIMPTLSMNGRGVRSAFAQSAPPTSLAQRWALQTRRLWSLHVGSLHVGRPLAEFGPSSLDVRPKLANFV